MRAILCIGMMLVAVSTFAQKEPSSVEYTFSGGFGLMFGKQNPEAFEVFKKMKKRAQFPNLGLEAAITWRHPNNVGFGFMFNYLKSTQKDSGMFYFSRTYSNGAVTYHYSLTHEKFRRFFVGATLSKTYVLSHLFFVEAQMALGLTHIRQNLEIYYTYNERFTKPTAILGAGLYYPKNRFSFGLKSALFLSPDVKLRSSKRDFFYQEYARGMETLHASSLQIMLSLKYNVYKKRMPAFVGDQF